jgi:hypothetical protein
VLVVAGSWGVGDVLATVEAIGRSGEFHPITVCGRDEKLLADLESRGFGTVIGWTEEMPALMTAADALVENAGGLTCMEAFAVGLPVITYLPIAGHGKDNAEMMARSGVNYYVHDEDELHRRLREVTAPGPVRDQLVGNGYRLFSGDPADSVAELAAANNSVDRKGRVVALRTPKGRRSVTVLAASIVALYVGLTIGAQAVSAIGVGVAKPPVNPQHAAYIGVRLDQGQLRDRELLTAVNDLNVTVVIDAQTASHRSPELEWLSDRNVDIANGGWGKGTLLPWNQARNDLDKAGKVIARETGEPTHEFVSGRRPDAFDQFFSRRSKQRLVVPDHTFGPESLPSTLEARKVYLLDGRDRDAKAMEIAVSDLETRLQRVGLHAHPLGELR